jgi:histidyl-tRNA synthetase
LDSKDQKDAPIIQNCPTITEFYNSTSTKRFDVVCQGLQELSISYKINPRLVRGLDYYDNTIFEFKCMNPNLGSAQGTVLAGGRYDGLVQFMSGKEKVPGIGYEYSSFNFFFFFLIFIILYIYIFFFKKKK